MNERNEDWVLELSGFATGRENMERDETLALGLPDGSSFPTVRLYRWKPWAISLGCNQDQEEIDGKACMADGIDVVRRPTGGRAILHAEELTYCVVMRSLGRSILQVYNDISVALLGGLRQFGVHAGLQKSQADFPKLYRKPSAVPCFSSSARYEIEYQGKKLVGSAQRRYGAMSDPVVLQHGSILCGPAHRKLADYLELTEPERQNIRNDLDERTTSLQEITGEKTDMDLLVEAIREGFETSWGIRFRRSVVVPERRESYAWKE